jgi:hypothetical protein
MCVLLGYIVFRWRNRIEAMGAPRMTMKYSVSGKYESFEGTMNLESFNRILGTGRNMTAGCRGQGRNGILVKIDRQQH